jgi:hypothetical protein
MNRLSDKTGCVQGGMAVDMNRLSECHLFLVEKIKFLLRKAEHFDSFKIRSSHNNAFLKI